MNEAVIVEKKKQTGGDEVVWPIVQTLMQERITMGMERYGEPLMTHNGLQMGILAIEEAIDTIMYVTAIAMEYNDAKARIAELEEENAALKQRWDALFQSEDRTVGRWAWVERE